METIKRSRKSASKWDHSSEWALLEIWGEKMSELRGCRKNSHILMDIVSELKSQGFKYTVLELKTKMHNMSARYRKEKRNAKNSGLPSEWEFYTVMEVLLAPYKSAHPEELVVDSINDLNSSIESRASSPVLPPDSPSIMIPSPLESDSPDPLVASSTAGIKKNEGLEDFFNKIEKNMKKMQEEIKKTSERVVAIEEEKKELLKSYVEREAEVQKAIVEFLKSP